MPGFSLSACLIVRDEEETLGATLASLRGWVTEIVVVDTGSQDQTPAIATDAGARVLFRPWDDDFSAARNVALSAATAQWCLMIDADETVRTKSWTAAERFFRHPTSDLGYVRVVSDSAAGRVSDPICRVCRNNGKFRYLGRIHEQLVGDGQRVETGLVLDHSGYQPEAIRKKDKLNRNIQLLRHELQTNPRDAYLTYQLGRTMWRRQPDCDAATYLESALALASPEAGFFPSIVRDLGYAKKDLGRAQEALALVRRYAPGFARFTDLFFLEGLLCLELGDATGMLAAFETCLELGEPEGFTSVQGVGTFRPHHNLGLFYELCGDLRSAISHYQRALAFAPGFAPAQNRLAALSSQEPAGRQP